MATAKLTLIGLESYLRYDDKSLFDLLTLPEGIDKDTLTGNIFIRSGEFEVMYPDAEFMRDAIGIWSRKWSRTFERWINALSIDYEPLNNYDRTEEWTTTEEIEDAGEHSETISGTNSETVSGTTSDSGSVSGSSTVNDSVSAYNNNTLVPDKQSTSTSSSNTSAQTTLSNTRSGTDSNTRSGTDGNTRDRSETRRGHAYGNIGVTTSQQMLQAELDLALWNLYDHISDLFTQEFCIPVYI